MESIAAWLVRKHAVGLSEAAVDPGDLPASVEDGATSHNRLQHGSSHSSARFLRWGEIF